MTPSMQDAIDLAAPKRRIQFSLRTLMVFVTLCAIMCSWLAVKLQHLRRQREAIAAVEKLGGIAWYDYQAVKGSDWPDTSKSPPPGPTWLRRLLGDDFFATVVGVHLIRCEVTDSDLEILKQFRNVKVVQIGDTNSTDAVLDSLKGLTELEMLGIGGTSITSGGEKALQKLLPNCKISRERPYHPGSTRIDFP